MPQFAMPTLYLLRHAKSDYPPGVADRDRPLSARGERDARAAAAWFAATAPWIDLVLVSPAVRAQQTWAAIAPAVRTGATRTDDRIYEDWGSDLGAMVAAIPSTATSAVVVGHNPGLEDLARDLGRTGDEQALRRLQAKYPTCGVAVLRLESWARSGDLACFVVPRG